MRRIGLWISVALCTSAWGQTAPMAIVNGASFAPGAPVAPGSIASIFGQNLCPNTQTGSFVAPGRLPEQLGGCSVVVNGQPAMLFYVSPGQMNIAVPSGAGTGNAPVSINNGSQMLSGTVMLSASAPGMFSTHGTGMGMGAILNGTTFQPGPFMMSPSSSGMPISIFVTGMDPSATPTVTIGGANADVTFSGPAPGFVGLQQINAVLPPAAIPGGRVPVMVTSGGTASNVTSVDVLPTTRMMAPGMMNMGGGMGGGAATGPVHQMGAVAINSKNGSALVTDVTGGLVRVMSMDSGSVLSTIMLPPASNPGGIAVNDDGSVGAVALSSRNSVELLDLKGNTPMAEIPVGVYPRGVAFAGSVLLATNMASDTVSMIDWAGRNVTRNVATGHGPDGIAVDTAHGRALIANMQSGSITSLSLSANTTQDISLGPGVRPSGIAVSSGANAAAITAPTTNQVLLMDLDNLSIHTLNTTASKMIGPNAVTAAGNNAYVTNMLSGNVATIDMAARRITGTINVDPGPRAIGVDPSHGRMMVLAQGAQALNAVTIPSGTVTGRMLMP